MQQNKKKYILLQDRVGSRRKGGIFRDSWTAIQACRGELFEALPEAEQPTSRPLIALSGIERKNVRLECSTSDLARLSDEEAGLLMAVTSAGERHTIYHNRNRLDAGKQLKESSLVWVKVKGLSKDVPGIVWYKGPIETSGGTMFGVELTNHRGQGITDGLYRNIRYFTCPADSGVFVSLDKLTPREDEPKGSLATLKKTTEHTPAALRGRTEAKGKKGKEEVDCSTVPLQIDQKVFVFLEDGRQVRGSVRYVGGAKDKIGRWYIAVGVELEGRYGEGNGMFQGKQRFICRAGFALFVAAENVLPVEETSDSQGRDKAWIRSKVRTTEDLHPYNIRYRDRLKGEADYLKYRSLHCIDSNRRDAKGDPQVPASPDADAADAAVGHSKPEEDSEALDAARRLGLEVGSMVEIPLLEGQQPRYGVIRWIGFLPALQNKLVAGVELEEEQPACSDGCFGGQRYFTCPPDRGFFVLMQNCHRDSRFTPDSPLSTGFYPDKATQTSHSVSEDMEGIRSTRLGMLSDRSKTEKIIDEQRRIPMKDVVQLEGYRSRIAVGGHDVNGEEYDELRNELDQIRRELVEGTNAKERQLEELREELAEATNEKERQRQLNSIERELYEARRELVEVTNAKERQLEELGEEMAEVVSNNENLRTELNELLSERARSQQPIESLQRERDELRSRVEALAGDWAINREEIHLTDTCLGTGAWASVKVGLFRGMKVAVKQIHELILSDFNRNLFAREMRMAACCRHPCLLQFIGATNKDGESPMLVTELLDKSLRSLLSERSLGVDEVVTIALDVAQALNYLHLNQPQPIIHRDISSANVLLWRRGDCWRAKVSDYGTANFRDQLQTVGPGAPIYCAPEAVHATRQSPKMDVYSFGVLLCEMCIRELPDPQRRMEQIGQVKHEQLRSLVTSCVGRVPGNRPDMADVLRELEALDSVSYKSG